MTTSGEEQELRITAAAEEGSQVLCLAGEIDMASAPELQRACMAAVDEGAKRVVLDTAEVTFIDSTGLGVIIALQKRLRAEGGETFIRSPSSVVRRLIDVTSLDRVVSIEGDEAPHGA